MLMSASSKDSSLSYQSSLISMCLLFFRPGSNWTQTDFQKFNTKRDSSMHDTILSIIPTRDDIIYVGSYRLIHLHYYNVRMTRPVSMTISCTRFFSFTTNIDTPPHLLPITNSVTSAPLSPSSPLPSAVSSSTSTPPRDSSIHYQK